MASLERYAKLLGYSGGAVPDSHRVPCCVDNQNQAADHQRTLTAVTLSGVNRDVKPHVEIHFLAADERK